MAKYPAFVNVASLKVSSQTSWQAFEGTSVHIRVSAEDSHLCQNIGSCLVPKGRQATDIMFVV